MAGHGARGNNAIWVLAGDEATHSVGAPRQFNSSLFESRSGTSRAKQSSSMMEVEVPKELLKPLQLPQRILTGPGPSNCSQRVLQALRQQVLGHMHPEVFQVSHRSADLRLTRLPPISSNAATFQVRASLATLPKT
jgi:hypothetical protein